MRERGPLTGIPCSNDSNSMARVFTPTPVHNDTDVANYGPSPSSMAKNLNSGRMCVRHGGRFLSKLPVNDDLQPSAEHESRPVRSDYRSGACSAGGIEMFYIGDSE